MIILLSSNLRMQAQEDYWVDLNFTRDSTMWKNLFPPLIANGQNMQCTPFGEYLGFKCRGAFGKFAPPTATYQPFNSESECEPERFIYAFRINKTSTSNWTFPKIPNASKIKVHVQCGAETTAGEFTLQKYISGEGDAEIWEELDPAIKFTVPGHALSTTDIVIEKELNFTEPVKLRFLSLGTSTYNVHLYAVSISKNDDTEVSENDIDIIQVNLDGHTLQIINENKYFKASIYNIAGLEIGIIRRGDFFNLPVAGSYLIRVENESGIIVKKIIVY